MSYLATKRSRDFRRSRWQFIAVFITIALGVVMFGASYDSYRNLNVSYNGTYDRLHFADMTVTGADPGFADTAAAVPGVAVAEERAQADIPFSIDDTVLIGRIVTMPSDGQPEVNQVDVTDGSYLSPSDPTGVLIETHLAEQFDLGVGDTFEIATGAGWTTVTVRGIAVSPEYLWPARSRQEFFSLPGTFGVAFVSADAVAAAAPEATANQVVMRYDEGADRVTVDAAVTDAANAAHAADIMTQADQPSNAGLDLDLKGFEQMAIAFPILFLIAAGMAAFILLTRIVYTQRSQIGTLRASGMSRSKLTWHYLSYGLILGTAGAIVGTILGIAAGWGITGMYTQSLGIPDTIRELRWSTAVVGILFGVVTGALAALAPALAVFHASPAEAMRGEVPTTGGGHSLVETVIPPLRRLPVRWLMVLRGVGRNKLRSLSTMLGVVLALTLVLSAWGMIDTVRTLLDRQFNEIDLSDATALADRPVDDDLVAVIAGVDGVAVAEPVITLPATAKFSGDSYGTQLQAYVKDTRVRGFLTDDGALPSDGILAGVSLKDEIGVDVGDTITITFGTLETSITGPIRGFVTEPMGTVLYMERDTLLAALAAADPAVPETTLGNPTVTTVATAFVDGVDRDAVMERIHDVDGVISVVDSREVYDLVQQFMGLFYAFIGIMIVFGGAMAFALIFNTISVNVAERSTEYATMRANGLSNRRVAALITGENVLLVSLGIIPGLIVGYLAAAWMMSTYSSDMIKFNLEMRPWTLVLAAIAMIIVALLSVIPGIRTVRRLNIVEVVRERAI